MMPPVKKMIMLSCGAAVCLAVLSGCGRRGAPELPASAYTQDEKGRQVRKPKPDKPFILDRLIKE